MTTLNSASESSEEDESPIFTDKSNKDFLRTLELLRSNDETIYKKDAKFYDSEEETEVNSDTTKKSKALTLRDYDREVILKKQGIINEEEEGFKIAGNIKSYHSEQADIKNEISVLTKHISSNDSDSGDELFIKRSIPQQSDLKSEPVICGADDKDTFIVNYLINQKWNDQEASDVDYSSGEELADRKYHKGESEELKAMFHRKLEEQVEADNGELIITPSTFKDIKREEIVDSKSYPRTGIQSVRQDRKAEKRAEKRAKKKAAEELKLKQKIDDMKRKKNEKVQDLKSKLEQLQEVVGMEIDIDPEMLEGDFDPDMHEKLMGKIEEDATYVDDEKPVFEDLDGFDLYDDDRSEIKKSKKERKRGKRSKKGEIDEQDLKEAEKYFPESVKQIQELDYEVDLVGDEELRFRYRATEPEDYGLTAEEMLNATDAELNQWVSLKQVTKNMTAEETRDETRYWSKKKNKTGNNTLQERKQKIFRSIYGTEEEKDRIAANAENKKAKRMNSKRRRKRKERENALQVLETADKEYSEAIETENNVKNENKPETLKASVNTNLEQLQDEKKKRKRKRGKGKVDKISDDRLNAYGLDAKDFKKAHIYDDKKLKYST